MTNSWGRSPLKTKGERSDAKSLLTLLPVWLRRVAQLFMEAGLASV